MSDIRITQRLIKDDNMKSPTPTASPIMATTSPLLPNPKLVKHWAKRYRTEIAASSSSVLSTFFAVSDLIEEKGALAPLASVTLVRTISFSIYQKVKYKFSAAIGRATGTDEPLVVVNRPGSVPTLSTIACFGAAGGVTGAVITTLACPFELTKLSAQISVLMADKTPANVDPTVRRSYQHKGTFKTAKNIVKHRGVMGLYSGFHLHVLRDTIGTGIYFMTYESGKQLLVKYSGSNSPTSPMAVAVAGGLCGLVSWACIYPIDSAKTHYQRNCLTKARGEAVNPTKIQFFNPKMYRGLGVSMARSCVINMIFFSSFEAVKKHINALKDPLQDTTVD
ncbi:MAG: hypothetical protein MMC33_005080 [Icmadophila ericetorum]|nr:hypothetical protein [Icmadophila ericetorum]